MLTIALWSTYEVFNKQLFHVEKFSWLSDVTAKMFLELKKYANQCGVNIDTVNYLDISSVDAFLFYEMPGLDNHYLNYALNNNKPVFLYATEPESVHWGRENYCVSRHKCFKKVFTWNDLLVDGKKYIKTAVGSFDFPKSINKKHPDEKKLCAIIASNKNSNHSLELYSKRKEAIRWFEANHPEEFDLYGQLWDGREYPSFRGPIDSKKAVLENYRFSICYENARDMPGYITEKIFDSMFAGCIPVYWGADNISDYIPGECYIDKTQYSNYEELYNYIKNIGADEYQRRLQHIENYLNSPQIEVYTNDYFARTIIDTIVDNIGAVEDVGSGGNPGWWLYYAREARTWTDLNKAIDVFNKALLVMFEKHRLEWYLEVRGYLTQAYIKIGGVK
ncbi:alpha (1,3)-fucosyltransferase [Desulfocucumis palustris]|uniref:Alpha (1,3)-fucosyltransferase n=1 Tax=Desulfocucumis palustris TaxID=1898651 RepID=A0A2L2XBG8_9FIRM|nr:glycosyltransferase family 10 [Desulfocucumis palustris]GBF33422.1 alpha (1,3)-fucosyltransferase [Desulfocucumis palustris]